MANYFDERNVLKCSCGNQIFKEEKTYTCTIEKDKYIKKIYKSFLICERCGNKIPFKE